MHKWQSSLALDVAFLLSAEKFFDWVECDELMAALSSLGPGFCKNDILQSKSGSFYCLSLGTLGNVLYLLLFAIFLETLALIIQANNDIRSVHAGCMEQNLFMYANEILSIFTCTTQMLSVMLF